MARPLIGITTALRTDENRGHQYVAAYDKNVKAVEQAGGLPVLLPSNAEESTLRALYERVDGVLLPGGGDIDPVHYGAELNPFTEMIDVVRDNAELTITRWAYDDNRPLLGICRGHQVVNVALGGTLIQDIPSQVQTPLKHDLLPGEPRDNLVHEVRIEADSRLAQIMQMTIVDVNSIHHQAVEIVAPGLTVTAYASDGVIEAAEIPEKPFFLTVQWHPEDLTVFPTMQRLFAAFVHAAANH